MPGKKPFVQLPPPLVEVAQPILEAPPLARALYRHAELGDEIPAALYSAVAEVLAYVYQLRRHREDGGPMPQQPELLPLAPGLDPGLDPGVSAA